MPDTTFPSAILLRDSLALKHEIADCYTQLAEQLDNFNNPDAAACFLKLAEQQQQQIHRLGVLASAQHPGSDQALPTRVDQESPADDINANSHYLMTPYHAVELALEIERTTQQTLLARLNIAESDPQSQPQQQEHAQQIQFLQQLLSSYPKPSEHWDEDLDPPFLDD
tara:strand:+ start:1455 stop:1958 length:504 start_codon:yes stop_codon:yes gene_type:complete